MFDRLLVFCFLFLFVNDDDDKVQTPLIRTIEGSPLLVDLTMVFFVSLFVVLLFFCFFVMVMMTVMVVMITAPLIRPIQGSPLLIDWPQPPTQSSNY